MDIYIKKCFVNTRKGQLKDAWKILSARSNLLTSEDALKIIITLCNASLDEKCLLEFTPNDMSDLLFICTKEIKGLDNNSMNSFLASIYYIVKYFLDMDYYKFVAKLENDFISIVHNNIRDNKLVMLCGNISKVIYNKILVKHTSMKSSDLLVLWIFSVKVLCEIKKLDDLLKEEISIYFRNLSMIQLCPDTQCDIYLFVLTLVEQQINEKTGLTYFQSTMNLLNPVIQTHFLSDGEFDKGKVVVFKTTLVFRKIKSLANMSTIMENIVSIICTEKKFPLNIKAVLLSIHKSFFKMYQERKTLQSMFHFTKFLLIILCSAKQNFRTFSSEFWSNFEVESQIILSKFIAHLSVSVSWIKSKCRMCKNCDTDYDFASAISTSGTPAYILKYWLSYNNNDNTNNKPRDKFDLLLNEVKKSLDLCCTWIQQLQKCNCNIWKKMWAEVGAIIYNLSLNLYRNKHIQAGLYTKYFIKKLILFEGTTDSAIQENILNVALSSLAESYLNAKDNVRAMLISAFNIFLHPQARESIFLQWVRIKSSEKDDTNLQNFNLVSIMMKHKNTLAEIHPNFNLTKEDEKDLLLFELRQYKRIWPSKLSLMTAFKEICQYNDVFTTAQGIVLSWGDADNILPVEMYDIVFKTVLEFESVVQDQSNIKNNIIMAFLYLVQYYVSCAKLQLQNKQDIKHEAPTETPGNSDIDKNDECDLFMLYESLRIDVHAQIIDYLKKSLNTFKRHINKENLQELKEMNVYVAMVKIGNEFLVQSYSLEYIQVWLLCYRLAKILKDDICVIESIGNLSEFSNLNTDFIKSALLEANNLILQINNDQTYKEGENAIRKWIVLTNFYISVGLGHLASGDIENSLNAFRISKEYYCSLAYMKKCELLRIKLEFFEWRLQLLPCSYKVENHTSALSKPFFLIEGISQCYKTAGYNAYVIHLLFQIFCSLLHMYRWLRQPREVRCYGKQILYVAQHLTIPLKCVQILSYLADADLLSVRIEDCRCKVNSICDILGLSRNKIGTTCSSDYNKKSVACNDEICSIANTLQEMMLDIPFTKPRYQESSMGSPSLLSDCFKVPSFIEHDDLCECLCCSSVDYQNLVMIRVNLQASMFYTEGNLEAAREYYEGALYIYKHLLNKQTLFQEKIEGILDAKVISTLENTFRETYCVILLGLGNTLITSDKFLNISINLIQILKKNPHLNYHLHNEAVFQKINYLSLKTCEVEKQSRKKDIFLSPIADDHVDTPTTPESKCSRVTITSHPSPVAEPAKRIVKLIKFDIPENDDNEQRIVSKPLSPLQCVIKTPAPAASKIKVYLPTPAKSIRKKKVVETLEFPSEYSEKANVNAEPPKSSKKLEAKLKTRTKLLTEKLKNVPKILVTNEMENECTKSDENKPRTRVRKNLTSKIESDSGNNENNKFTNCASSSSSNSDINSNGAVKKRTRSNKIL